MCFSLSISSLIAIEVADNTCVCKSTFSLLIFFTLSLSFAPECWSDFLAIKFIFSFRTSQQLLGPAVLLIPFVLAAKPKYLRLGFLKFDGAPAIFVCFIFSISNSFTQRSKGCLFFHCWMIAMRSFLLFLLGEVGLWTTFLVGMRAFFQSIYFLPLVLFLSLLALTQLA